MGVTPKIIIFFLVIFYSKASSYWVTPISGNPHSQAEGAETAGGLS